MPERQQRPTMASLQEQLARLDQEIGRLGDTTARERYEAGRTRRGLTGAFREAVQSRRLANEAHERVDQLEERAGLLETASVAILDRLSAFAGMFRTQQADLADHEERISNHQVRISNLEERADADGNIVGVWAVTVTVVEVFIFLAWLVMADWKNGLNQSLADTPSYDSVFIWLAIGSAIVISLVALCMHFMRDGSEVATRRSAQAQPAGDDAGQPDFRRGAPPVNADDPTQVMPAVVVDETQELPVS